MSQHHSLFGSVVVWGVLGFPAAIVFYFFGMFGLLVAGVALAVVAYVLSQKDGE